MHVTITIRDKNRKSLAVVYVDRGLLRRSMRFMKKPELYHIQSRAYKKSNVINLAKFKVIIKLFVIG